MHYFTGKPCKRGHITKRLTSCGNCLECIRLKSAALPREQQRKYNRKSYQKHKASRRASQRGAYEDNKEKTLSRCAKYRDINRDKVRRRDRARNRLRNTGFTPALFEERIQQQKFACAICGELLLLDVNTHADHCHTTGTCRGVLCRGCNTGLGFLKEDEDILQKAIQYLQYWKGQTQ